MVAAVHVVICLAIFGSTYWPGGPLLPDVFAIPVSLVPVFPYWFVAIAGSIAMAMDSRTALGGVSGFGVLRQIWRRVPKPLILLAVATFYGAWFVGLTNIVSLTGQPEVVNGQYALNDHGSITVIDRVTYERALGTEERLFASGGLAFGAIGLLLLSAARDRAGEGSRVGPPVPAP